MAFSRSKSTINDKKGPGEESVKKDEGSFLESEMDLEAVSSSSSGSTSPVRILETDDVSKTSNINRESKVSSIFADS